MKYKLYYYNLSDTGGLCFETNDLKEAELEALKRCSIDNGEYTYRMEIYDDGGKFAGWRFFQNGREFTRDIYEVLISNYKKYGELNEYNL